MKEYKAQRSELIDDLNGLSLQEMISILGLDTAKPFLDREKLEKLRSSISIDEKTPDQVTQEFKEICDANGWSETEIQDSWIDSLMFEGMRLYAKVAVDRALVMPMIEGGREEFAEYFFETVLKEQDDKPFVLLLILFPPRYDGEGETFGVKQESRDQLLEAWVHVDGRKNLIEFVRQFVEKHPFYHYFPKI